MLNYQDLISRLGEQQKIKIVSDIVSLDDSFFAEHKIPKLKIGYVKNYLEEMFPKPSVLVNSFDKKLWKEIAYKIAIKMKNDGVNFAISFGPKPKLRPLSSEISEDVFVSVEMSAIFAREIMREGLVVGLDDCYLVDKDLKWIDKNPSKTFIAEFFVKPYIEVIKRSGCFAIITPNKNLGGKYSGVNKNLQKTVVDEINKEHKAFLVSLETSASETVKDICDKIITFKGSETKVLAAVKDGLSLETEFKNGYIDIDQIDIEISKGHVITLSMLDEAVDRTLDFLYTCNTFTRTGYTLLKREELLKISKESVFKSTVILKSNKKLLPFKKVKNVAIVGDIASLQQLDGSSIFEKLSSKTDIKFNFQFIKGYDLNKDRSDDLLLEIDKKAIISNRVVVFLGLNDTLGAKYSKMDRGELPANQKALISKLLAYRDKVVIVLSSEYQVGIDFIKDFSCVIYSPIKAVTVADCLYDIFLGNYRPNGKIAHTLIDNYERRYLLKNRECKNLGALLGYREYVSIDKPTNNHFGYGLTIGKTKYKRAKVRKGVVKVKLKNKSKVAIDKVVQVYIGLKDNKELLQPKYTLQAFERVYIKPKKRATVKIAINIPYAYLDGKYKALDSEYEVYVGESCQNVAKIGKIKKQGKELDCCPNLDWLNGELDSKNLHEYYASISNVKEENYMLEAKREKMKRSKKNLTIALGSIIMAIAIFMFNSISQLGAIFLNVVAGILCVDAVVFFVIDIIERNKAYKLELKKIDDANKKLFSDAIDIKTFDADKMFNDEFDTVVEISEAKEEKHVHSEEDEFKHVNKSLSLNKAIEDFMACANEKGVSIDKESASLFFSSLVSSKLIAIDNLDSKCFDKFMASASKYFSTSKYVDNVQDAFSYSLVKHLDNGSTIKSQVISGLEQAVKNKDKIYLIGLDNVRFNTLKEYFEQFEKFIANPKSEHNYVLIENESYKIPENVWFVVNVSNEENIKTLDIELARGISINSLNVKDCEPSVASKQYALFTYQQLDYLATKSVETLAATEETWKKFDKLENFAIDLSKSQFGNKMFRAVEKQIAILLEAENTLIETVDLVLATKIIPFMLIELKEFNLKNEGFVEFINNVFGDANVTYTHSKTERYIHYSTVEENV